MFEDVNLLRWMLAVLALVLMFGSLVIILQKLQTTGGMAAKKQGRLKIGERLMLDGRRKLLLIEHDDKEHLILLGHQSETLISSGKKQDAGKKPGPKKTVQEKTGKAANKPTETA